MKVRMESQWIILAVFWIGCAVAHGHGGHGGHGSDEDVAKPDREKFCIQQSCSKVHSAFCPQLTALPRTICHVSARTWNEFCLRKNYFDRHIKEHLKDEVDMDTEKMSEEELQFYHFKLHDSDNNTVLDGLEVFKAVIHGFEAQDIQNKKEPPRTYEQMKEQGRERERAAAENVDQFMKAVDGNNDGYITFVEYKFHMQYVKERTQKRDKM